jgi:hypothetical protein
MDTDKTGTTSAKLAIEIYKILIEKLTDSVESDVIAKAACNLSNAIMVEISNRNWL